MTISNSLPFELAKLKKDSYLNYQRSIYVCGPCVTHPCRASVRDAEPEVSRGGTSSAVTAAAICRTRSARIHAAAAQKQDGSSSAAAFCLCRPVPMLSYHIQQKAQQQISVSVQHLLGSRISARTTGNRSFAEGPALPRASPRQRPPLPTAKKDPRQRAFTDGSALGKARPSEKASFAEMLALGKDRLSASLGKGAAPGTASVVVTFAESHAVRLSAKRMSLPSALSSSRQRRKIFFSFGTKLFL